MSDGYQPPKQMEVLTRKKIGHYWHVTGVVDGVKRSYRMPDNYMRGNDKEQEETMKQGLELITDHEGAR